MPIFRKQGHGTLINVGSILSKVGQPFVPSYVISKFALRGLTDALRAEFADERDIHVCTALPYAMNTPHFETAASHAEHPAHAMAPEQAPSKVARAIVDLARHPRRELHVPRVATLGLALHALVPRTVERLILHLLQRYHFDSRGQPTTNGNLYAPTDESGPVRGHRPPRLTVARALAFVLRDLLRMQGQAFERALANLRNGLRVIQRPASPPRIPSTVASLVGHD
jgi:NAD(P)-dependent dehydrogenase (short-subunit alcohol dehydrogenase family)